MSEGFSLGVFYTIVRPEEKAILAAADARGIAVQRIDDGQTTFGLERPAGLPDVVVNRSVSHSRSLYATRFFTHYGVPTVNTPEVTELAGDKILTSLRLAERGIPTPRTVVALSPEAALKAIAHTRSGKGPYMVECVTVRCHEHSVGSVNKAGTQQRAPELMAKWRHDLDPAKLAAKRLIEDGVATEEQITEIWAETAKEPAEIEAFCEQSPRATPPIEDLVTAVYAA